MRSGTVLSDQPNTLGWLLLEKIIISRAVLLPLLISGPPAAVQSSDRALWVAAQKRSSYRCVPAVVLPLGTRFLAIANHAQ